MIFLSFENMKRFFPFLLIFLFTLWYTYPLWGYPNQMFAIHPTGDNIRSMHFYDFMGYQIQSYGIEDIEDQNFSQFDRPFSPKVREFFPAIAEVLLMAPIVWLFDWPQHWSVILTIYIAIAAFGTMYLCQTLGGNLRSLLLCGILTVVARPIWTDIANGRINSITIGFSFLAMGLMFRYLQERHLGKKIALYGMTLCFGYFSIIIYPPYPLLLFPFGLIYYVAHFRGQLIEKFWQSILVFVPLILGTFPELIEIHQSNTGILQCENSGCISYRHVMSLEDLFLTRTLSYTYGGMAAGLWVGIFAVCFRKHHYLLGFVVIIVLYSVLSGGTCPTYGDISLRTSLSFLEPLWCLALHIHDFRRLATIGCLMLIVLLSLLYTKVSQKTGIKFFQVLFLIWVPFQVQTRQHEFLQLSYWHALNRTDPILEVISDKGVVAILPYDLYHQFMNTLQKKNIRLLNPYENMVTKKRNPFDNWIHEIGYGRLEPYTFNPEDVKKSRIVQIIFDRKRCEFAIRENACNEKFQNILRDSLGPPSVYKGMWVWNIEK